MSEISDRSLAEKTKEILGELSPEDRQLLVQIIRAESDKLHMKKPHGIQDDLWKIVTEAIK